MPHTRAATLLIRGEEREKGEGKRAWPLSVVMRVTSYPHASLLSLEALASLRTTTSLSLSLSPPVVYLNLASCVHKSDGRGGGGGLTRWRHDVRGSRRRRVAGRTAPIGFHPVYALPAE